MPSVCHPYNMYVLHFIFLLGVLQTCQVFHVQHAQTKISTGTIEHISCIVFGCCIHNDNEQYAFRLMMS